MGGSVQGVSGGSSLISSISDLPLVILEDSPTNSTSKPGGSEQGGSQQGGGVAGANAQQLMGGADEDGMGGAPMNQELLDKLIKEGLTLS